VAIDSCRRRARGRDGSNVEDRHGTADQTR
jgi:hypothetical protein